jgi:methylenetetrahydrofolate dehydrogenase (NADP+)/methenyltetrahydrofolate cyclohydrolase
MVIDTPEKPVIDPRRIDGTRIAEGIHARLAALPHLTQFLAAVLVGSDPAAMSFLKKKASIAKELGVDFRLFRFPETVSSEELRREVTRIATYDACGGIVVQLPLPDHIDKRSVMNDLPPEKDVDVLGERAALAARRGKQLVVPPPVGVIEVIRGETGFVLETAQVAIVGLGFLVGRPVAAWMGGRVKELHTLDTGSDLSVLADADLVISGTGSAGLLKPENMRSGAGVIDFGYAHVNGKLAGDLDTSVPKHLERLAFYTPTPGGTGPILVAKLFENFFALNQK